MLRRNSTSDFPARRSSAEVSEPSPQRRVEVDSVLSGLERLELAPAHAEPPLLLPVRGAVRHQVGVVGVGEDVLAQLLERDGGVDRHAVAEDVERRIGEVDDALSVGPLDPGAADRPFAGHLPVEDLRPRRRLDDLEWEVAGEHGERLADSVSGEAAGEREELPHQLEQLAPERCRSSGVVSQLIGIGGGLQRP